VSHPNHDEKECKRILALSRSELEAEVRARGKNPENIIAEVDRIIAAAKVDAYRRRIKYIMERYGEQANATQVPAPQSLLADSGRANDRLAEIYSRVIKLGDSLHGTAPRGAPPAAKTESAATIRRNVDRSLNLLTDIENELTHIESRL